MPHLLPLIETIHQNDAALSTEEFAEYTLLGNSLTSRIELQAALRVIPALLLRIVANFAEIVRIVIFLGARAHHPEEIWHVSWLGIAGYKTPPAELLVSQSFLSVLLLPTAASAKHCASLQIS